jgi:general secretion pathway protein A
MNYYGILNLTKEPFSNSPDPEFFFQSREHHECLQKLELSLHLRRGLNVVIGDVGTGKTTLCRQLIRRFTQRPEHETHLILDPSFPDATEFLRSVAKIVSGKVPAEGASDTQIKEFIKNSLFRKGVDEDKTMILIIDEGQKIPPFCLELLREFLNYETNEFKLLQIVVFAQKEFEETVGTYPNFADRINLYHILKPLSFRDTRLMINYRLEKSSNSPHRSPLFSYPALVAIYRATGGYPRKIINLCHQCILAMIIQNKRKVGVFLVRKCANRVFRSPKRRFFRTAAAATGLAVAAVVILAIVSPDRVRPFLPEPYRHLISWKSADSEQPVVDSGSKETIKTEAPAAAQLTPGELDLPVPAATPAAPPAPPSEPVAPPVESRTPEPEAEILAAAMPEAHEAAEPQPLTYPEILGVLEIERNETISGIIHSVYGEYNSRYFRSLVLANPAIDDPDRIPVGQRIAIPAVPLALTPPRDRVYWVKLDESDRLQSVFDRLRKYPGSAPAVKLIGYWTPREGNRFALVLKQHFSNEETAGLQLKLLPARYSKSGQVVSSWGKDAVFFANPYAENSKPS